MYTKGPWIYGGQYGDKGIEIVAGDKLLAVAFHSGREFDETMSNARLIAAAPEMYEACLSALGALSTVEPTNIINVAVKSLKQALAKAEGRA